MPTFYPFLPFIHVFNQLFLVTSIFLSLFLMVLSLQPFIAFVGNNESSSQPNGIYIIDYIAISHLFVCASEAFLWKSYITLSALPEQFDSSEGDKKGCTSSHFNTVCDELCSSSHVCLWKTVTD